MRLHLISLPHTQVSSEFCGCAYTGKILKFCKMMGKVHDIHLYAPEGPDVTGATLHSCLTDGERLSIFGPDDPHRLPVWPSPEQTKLFNDRVIESLKPDPRDLILLSAGYTHQPIAEKFPNHILCEPGVGYNGFFTPYCAFESYAWMHHCYAKKKIDDGRFYDTVIPNYFDRDEFPYLNDGKGKFILFLGRLIQRKGAHIASEIAQRCGLPLWIAGAGGKQVGDDVVGKEITIKNAYYVGPVDVKERGELLAKAKCLICPTTYIEPFGGVAVEAMMAGTPAIATDWGAFTETIKPGLSGFRFRTLSEGVKAVENVETLIPMAIKSYALENYSLEVIRHKFKSWFDNLNSLWDKGWYSYER